MSDIHILVPPIKDEPGDDIACIASSGGLEEELDDLNAVVLKEIKPFTIKLQAQVNKIEKDITTVERATECSHNKIVGLTKEMADLSKSLQTMKLRVDAMQAGSRTPWLRRDDGQQQPSNINDEVKQTLEEYKNHLLNAAHALNDHNAKITKIEQALTGICTILQLQDGTNLNDAVRELDTREQIAEERITMLEEKESTFVERLDEVSSILGNEPLMPNEGELTDLLTRRVATMEQQTTKWVSTVAKTSEMVSRLSLAQTINASVSADTTIDNDVAAALNARMDTLSLRVDKLERLKTISDHVPLRGARQHTTTRGGSAVGGRAIAARGGNSNREKRRETRADWTPYPNVPAIDNSPLIDTSKSLVNEQPKPASFQVDEAQVSQEEKKQKSVFNNQMNQIARMYQKEELIQKAKDIDLALSRAPPFLDVHDLSYEQLITLKDKVNAVLEEGFSYVAAEQMVENDAPWG